MEIARNVYRVTVGSPAFAGVYPPNVYLVAGSRGAAFVDTAYGKDEEVAAQLALWETLGSPEVAAIILTHRHSDHIGGAARLRDATGGQVISSSDERIPIEGLSKSLRVDQAVRDGETLDLGGATLEFIAAPGHTLGSLCVYYREEGILFTGDHILGSGTTVVSPDEGDMGFYIESLRKLIPLEARLICPGHGPVINQPRAKVQELIAHRLDREREILHLLQRGARTIEELLQAIYPELDPRLHLTARNQIRSHLMKLSREGQASEASDGSYAAAHP